MIFDKIKKAISAQTGIDEGIITLESSFREDLNIDSIDLVELIMQLEEEYDIEFDDDQAETLKTVGDVVNYLNENL
ncbi:MAG: acyl carrier protein [Clostridia bacterium]|nr:acyl carrier protein [Clostridia bacterium]MBO5453811.1 acyl carrier protein [Clostridia bacterium]